MFRLPEQDEVALTEMLSDIVSRTLRGVLGEFAGGAVVHYLEISGSLADPKTFANRLERTLGKGAVNIEKIIVNDLYDKVGLASVEGERFDFEKSVDNAGQKLAGMKKVI
jgi:hypothetical protein